MKSFKNNFYRTLNLRKEDKEALKVYTEIKKQIEKSDKKEDK
jgi:hypothetical protein